MCQKALMPRRRATASRPPAVRVRCRPAARTTSRQRPGRVAPPPAIVGAGAALYGRAGIGEATAWPLEPPRQGPVAQWLEPAAHNGLVGGSSPPGPTTQSRVCGNFPAAGEKPPDGGMRRERLVSVTCDLDWRAIWGPYCLASKSGFPEARPRQQEAGSTILPPTVIGVAPLYRLECRSLKYWRKRRGAQPKQTPPTSRSAI
jgi:hypothetical protein